MKIRDIMNEIDWSNPTLKRIKDHVELIMQAGGPKNKEELEVVKIFNNLTGGKAFNAGKRKDPYIKKARNV